MSIQEISLNFKHFLKNSDVWVVFVFIAVAVGSFFLGRASVAPANSVITADRQTGTVIQATTEEITPGAIIDQQLPESPDVDLPVEGGYVASKSGTKYHLPWCSGAKRIKEENKVWFKTQAEAEDAGYTPAANCKGI
jgi:hypothetical protein